MRRRLVGSILAAATLGLLAVGGTAFIGDPHAANRSAADDTDRPGSPTGQPVTEPPLTPPATGSASPQQLSDGTSTAGSRTMGGPGGPGSSADTAEERRPDRRYDTCEQVVAAGLGPYKADRDPEYDWYPDSDRDGWACERGPARPRVHYHDCDEAWAAGAAPLHRGEPGYGRHLDRDGDGVACD
ncbi:MAG TPA: excalibur calcium-binding domain-containing protein [Micromonosporaceae bacterium]